jgi:hypothetical protein
MTALGRRTMTSRLGRVSPSRSLSAIVGLLALAVIVSACGSDRRSTTTAGIPRALIAESRPIGAGPRFRPPVSGSPTAPCNAQLGPRVGAHVEVFAANRVVLLPAGIGAAEPLGYSAGRISRARCFGALVTIDPTGLVLVSRGSRMSLSALFRSWGQPLSPTRVASFPALPGGHVEVFVGGRLWHGDPRYVPLSEHAEIVLEVGPHVPPHSSYEFPPGT